MIDCGACPRISTGCQEGGCLRAATQPGFQNKRPPVQLNLDLQPLSSKTSILKRK